MKHILFFIIFPLIISGCVSTTERGSNKLEKTQNERQLRLREIFDSNIDKVPLIYRSQSHFDTQWNEIDSVEKLLRSTASWAISATGTDTLVEKPKSILVKGNPVVDVNKKQLTYNVIWDTDNPWCLQKGQCLQSENQLKRFAKGYTQDLISGELTCRSALLWNYLAYGSSVIYNLYDAKGILFYSYKISVDNCPTNKQSF